MDARCAWFSLSLFRVPPFFAYSWALLGCPLGPIFRTLLLCSTPHELVFSLQQVSANSSPSLGKRHKGREQVGVRGCEMKGKKKNGLGPWPSPFPCPSPRRHSLPPAAHHVPISRHYLISISHSHVFRIFVSSQKKGKKRTVARDSRKNRRGQQHSS